MQSNLVLQSNVYVNRTGFVRDPEFVRQVRGIKALKELERRLGTNYANRLTATQRAELDRGITKCSYDPDHSFGYLQINGQLRWVNRCEQTECANFPGCSAHPNFVPIQRDQPIAIRKKPETQTLGIIDYSLLQHYSTQAGSALSPLEDTLPEPEPETEHPVVLPPVAEAVEIFPGEFSYGQISDAAVLIESPPSARILVNAGPGTGKTYTVIQRLAYLAQTRAVNLQNVLVLCFSRSAVAVIRERLEEQIETGKLPFETRRLFPNIRTIDSFATLMIRETAEALEQLSYDERIETFIALAQEYGEDFGQLEYLIIDEIQDLVGVRARMIKTILEHLQCGFLLLGDKCQSIYDYLLDPNSNELSSAEFYAWLESRFGAELQGYELTENKRQLAHLISLAGNFRQAILTNNEIRIKQSLQQCTSSLETVTWSKLSGFLRMNSNYKYAILCQTNARAATMAQKLYADEIPHTVALGSQRVLLVPWIGKIFADYTERLMGRNQFIDKANKIGLDAIDKKWELLKTLEGQDNEVVLDAAALKTALFRGYNIPQELDLAVQAGGVVISTIYRAKGKEYDGVIWVQERRREFEPKVAYVAVTRPKRSLYKLPIPYPFYVKNLSSNRTIQLRWPRGGGRQYCAAFLLGFENDLEPTSFVAGSPEEASVRQTYIKEQVKKGDIVTLVRRDQQFYVFHDGMEIGRLSPRALADLKEAMRVTNGSPLPLALGRGYVRSVVTIVHPGYNGEVPQPYAASGFWLGIELGGMAKTEWQ